MGLGVPPWGNVGQQLLLLPTGSLVDFLKTSAGIKLTISKLLDMAAQVRRLGRVSMGTRQWGKDVQPTTTDLYPAYRFQRAWHSLKSTTISIVT